MTDHRRPLVEFEDDPGPQPRPRGRYGPVIAIVLGLVAATVVLFSTGDTGLESVDSTTTTEPPSLGTVATPTTVLEPGAPPVPTETSLGTLTWTEAEFDTPFLPSGEIQYDPLADGYVLHTYNGDGVWRSPDGLTWGKDNSSSPFGDTDYVAYLGEFAMASERIYEVQNGEWVELSLKKVPTPDIEDLDWFTYPGAPVTSGGMTVFPIGVVGTVPWGDIYGTFEHDCGLAEPCESSPWAGWSPYSQRFEVHDPETGSSMATIEAGVSGNRVELAEVESGQVVYRIRFDNRSEAEHFLTDLDQSGSLLAAGVLVDVGDSHEFFPAPWAGYANLHATESGFVAFENFEDPGGSLDEPPRIWSSPDGRIWEDSGSVDFLPDFYQYAQVQTVADKLVARIVTDWNPNSGENGWEEWVSPDGVAWTKRVSALAAEAWIQKANYGFMATGWIGFDPKFWVSADGVTWEGISLPVSRATDSALYGTAGDLIYHSAVAPTGISTLWIGRFVD